MSLVIYSPSHSPDSTTKECPICLGKADHTHFGSFVSCCNGCAAFFRRSVVEHQSYRCRRDEQCVSKREKGKRGCRYCRFQACLRAGMNVNAVLAKPHPTTSVDEFGNGSLVFLLKCRRAMFVCRSRFLVEMYGGPEKYQSVCDKIKTATSCQIGQRAEQRVLFEFLKMMEIDEDPQFLRTLVEHLLPFWMHCESLFMTATQKGFNSKQAYYLDGSYLHYDMASLTKYYSQYGIFEDPELIARSSINMFNAIMETSKQLYDNRISDSELAAIQLLFLLQIAIKIHPRPEKYKRRLDQFFRSLKKHYDDNYEEVAVRIANIVMAMQNLQEVKRFQDEFFAVQYLDTNNRSKKDLWN